LGPGDLVGANRDELPFGGSYLIGEHFVEYLAETYGEEKLWKLVDVQGRSVFSLFGVTLRFKEVYGKSIGALLEDYSRALAAHLPDRPVPVGQTLLAHDLGPFARLATARDGTLATVQKQRDD